MQMHIQTGKGGGGEGGAAGGKGAQPVSDMSTSRHAADDGHAIQNAQLKIPPALEACRRARRLIPRALSALPLHGNHLTVTFPDISSGRTQAHIASV